MTLTMRNYGLVLPKNYVSIEKDEMEYIDGGIYSKTWDSWHGKVLDVYLNSEEATKLAIGVAGILAIGGAWLLVCPPAAAFLWTMSVVYGGYISWLNADGSGIIVRSRFLGNTSIILSTIPIDR